MSAPAPRARLPDLHPRQRRTGVAGDHRPRVHQAVLPPHGVRVDARARAARTAWSCPTAATPWSGRSRRSSRAATRDDVAGRSTTRRRPRSHRAGSSGCSPRASDGVTKVTTIHRDLGLSPVTSASVGDGWIWILHSMKSLLETGEAAARRRAERRRRRSTGATSVEAAEAEQHRRHGDHGQQRDVGAARRSRSCRRTRSTTCSAGRTRRPTTGGGPPAAARRTRPAARGSSPGCTPCSATATSRCTTPTGVCEVVDDAGLDDFDLAYAHEARARALACLGRRDEAAVELKAAHAVPIADAEDKAILDADLASEPWYGLEI